MTDVLYQCPICLMHYRDQAVAKRCEDFCSTYNACSLEITKLSVELNEEKS